MDIDEPEVSVRTHVSIRIFAPNLLPEDVTANLQITPDHVHHQGDYPRNNPKYSPYKHGMWLVRSKVSEREPLEAHLDALLSVLESNLSYIKALPKVTTVDFYCVLYSQSGFQLSPEVLKRMGDCGAVFGVVLYNNNDSLSEIDVNADDV